jgi:RNA polymerase sigma-70 factor (ECF subfamily)
MEREIKLPEDKALILQFVREGNHDAFITLVRKHSGEMRRVLFVLLKGNREDMEDAEQEIILSLFQSLPSFKNRSSFKTYFYRLCRNKAIALIRKKSRARRTMGADATVLLTDPEEDLLNKEKREEILSTLFKLKDEERDIVILKDVEGLSVKEISQILQLPEGTVKSRLLRSREKLAMWLRV